MGASGGPEIVDACQISVYGPRMPVATAQRSTQGSTQRPTTAVIGAGISGLTAGKMLGDYGVPYTCFEMSDRIGGNWAFGNPNGHSSAYRSLHIDTSKHRLSFKDFPMPDEYPDFPHHTQIKDYLDVVRRRVRPAASNIEFGTAWCTPSGSPTGAGRSTPGRRKAPLRPAGGRERSPLGPADGRVPRRIHRRVDPLPPLHRPDRPPGLHEQADPRRRHRQQCGRHRRRAVDRGRCRTRSPSPPARAPGSCRSTPTVCRPTSTTSPRRTSRWPGSASSCRRCSS